MKNRTTYYPEIFQAIFSFLLTLGVSKTQLKFLIASALKNAEVSTQNQGIVRKSQTAFIFGAAFYKWYRDIKYLDRNAEPKPLPLRGNKQSIESLLRNQGIRGRTLDEYLAQVIKLGLVKQISSRRYKPAGQVALLRHNGPALIEYIGASFTRLLSTFRYNTRLENHPAPLVERAASITDLPETHIEAFKEFTREQARSFLASIDDWLETRRPTAVGRERRVRVSPAGVHVYAYLRE